MVVKGGRARWGQKCDMCSVPVMDERGRLGGMPGEWTVTCGRCEDVVRRTGIHGHGDHRLPEMTIDKPPSNIVAGPILLRAYGIAGECRFCGSETTRAVGIRPCDPAPTFRLLVLATTDTMWNLVDHLLDRARDGGGFPGMITQWRSPHGYRLLHGDCHSCGAEPDQSAESLVREVAGRGVHGLNSLAVGGCSIVKWHRALYDPHRTFVRV